MDTTTESCPTAAERVGDHRVGERLSPVGPAIWESATLTLILPFDARRDLESDALLDEQARWAPSTQGQVAAEAAEARDDESRAVEWFQGGRLWHAVTPEAAHEEPLVRRRLHVTSTAETLGVIRRGDTWLPVRPLEEAGYEVSGIERRLFPNEEGGIATRGFVLAHLGFAEPLLANAEAAVAAITKPGEEFRNSLEALCRAVGVDVAVEADGRTASRRPLGMDARPIGGASRQVFTVMHGRLGAATTSPHAPDSGSLRDRATRMATICSDAASRGLLPRRLRPAQTALGGAVLETDAGGMVLVNGPGMDPEVSQRLRHLAHTRYVDLALLALRQRDWLEGHAESLASISDEHPPHMTAASTTSSLEALDRLLTAIVSLEKRLAAFRNTTWFTSVPGRPDGTAVLKALQESFQLPALLDEVGLEQSNWARIAQLDVSLARQKETSRAKEAQRRRDLEAQAEREAAARARQIDADARSRAQDRITLAVAVLAVPSLVFAWISLASNPSWQLAALALPASGALTVLARVLYLRSERSRSGEPDQAPSDQQDIDRQVEAP